MNRFSPKQIADMHRVIKALAKKNFVTSIYPLFNKISNNCDTVILAINGNSISYAWNAVTNKWNKQ